MLQVHSVGRAARALAGEEGVGSPRGLSVASCSGCYIPQNRAAVLGAQEGQRTRQKTKQGPAKGGPDRDTWALPWAQDQAGWMGGHIPRFCPCTQGSAPTQHSFGFLFNKTHRDVDFSSCSHQDWLYPDT